VTALQREFAARSTSVPSVSSYLRTLGALSAGLAGAVATRLVSSQVRRMLLQRSRQAAYVQQSVVMHDIGTREFVEQYGYEAVPASIPDVVRYTADEPMLFGPYPLSFYPPGGPSLPEEVLSEFMSETLSDDYLMSDDYLIDMGFDPADLHPDYDPL